MTTWPQALAEPAVIETFAHELADEARALIVPHLRRAVHIDYKSDETPVTEIDKAVEKALRGRIVARFPEHGIIGEEFGNQSGSTPFTWVLDPIDGTKAFITGRPEFGSLIGLLNDGVPLFGVLEAPVLSQRWTGGDTIATTVNGVACWTSNVSALADARLSATTPDMFDTNERARFDALGERVRFRVFGGDCYTYGLVASGCLDLVVEAGMKVHDFLALVPIVTGAGGVMTDWDGRPLTAASSTGRVLAAATPALHRAALEILGNEH
jgi:inositol-phosphate phosphatase/L-galactose 1-phosphate phosphatase/histidinol-phosphatase